MIRHLLPGAVACAETFSDLPSTVLFAEEEAAVSGAVASRRQEFTTVRACARTAFGELGLPVVPLPPGRRGEPTWPHGVVGSMTHCTGYRAAAVAVSHRVTSVGIDAEQHEPLPQGVLRLVASTEEQLRLQHLARREPELCWDRVLFSAKESLYKAWYPLDRRRLDFADADVVVDPAGTFTARLSGAVRLPGGGALTELTGRWAVAAGLVLTAVSVSAGAAPTAAA